MGVENASNRPAADNFFKPVVIPAEKARCPDSVELEILPHVVVSRGEISLAVEGVRSRVEISVEISRIIIFRLREYVLSVDLEGV